jgi:UDP-glucose 4-epimerase
VIRTVLVTGGAGFIGSALARRLVARGDQVRIIDDLSIGSLRYLDGVDVDFVQASLADRDAVRSAIAGVDAVVHLAARAGIVDSITDPMATFRANVVDTIELLEAARHAGVQRFVVASSNAVIGNAEPPFDEEMPPRPLTPYGASKLAGEAYCQAYAGSFGMAACALRFSNVYGPRSFHKKSVVASWLRAIFEDQPIIVHGDGEQTRDFIYVDDLADGIIATLGGPPEAVTGEIFQIGTGREATVNELADGVRQASERTVEVQHAAARAGDTERNVGRVEKAAAQLGFQARVPLVDGLRATAAWFKVALDDPALAKIRPVATSGSE